MSTVRQFSGKDFLRLIENGPKMTIFGEMGLNIIFITRKSLSLHGVILGNMSTGSVQVHVFLANLQELLKGDELGYRRRAFQKSSTTISLI